MDLIANHIAYLLLSCRKVAVPGLGTFSTSYEKAHFDDSEGYFYPSHIRINFSQAVQENMILLNESLQRRFKIQEEEVQTLINRFVSLINFRLQKNNYCRLEGIGYLLINNKGKICLKDTFWKNQKNSLTPISV